MILAGKRLLITGVITKDSIAFHAAEQAQNEGAEVLLTSFGRVKRMTERAARGCRRRSTCSSSTSTGPRIWTALADSLRERWGEVDGVLHAIAFAPRTRSAGSS